MMWYNGGYEALCITITAINQKRLKHGQKEFITLETENGVSLVDEMHNVCIRVAADALSMPGRQALYVRMIAFLELLYLYSSKEIFGELYSKEEKVALHKIISDLKKLSDEEILYLYLASDIRYENLNLLPKKSTVYCYDSNSIFCGVLIKEKDFCSHYMKCLEIRYKQHYGENE